MQAVVSYGHRHARVQLDHHGQRQDRHRRAGSRHQERRLVRRLRAGRGAAGGGLGADRPRRRGWRDRCADRAADDRGRPAVSGVRGIVLDMEGVLHVDWSPIAGVGGGRRRAGGRRHRAGRADEHHGQDAGGDRGAAGGHRLRAAGRADRRRPHRPPPSTSAPSTRASACMRWSSRVRSASWTGSSWSMTRASPRWCCWAGPTRSWTYPAAERGLPGAAGRCAAGGDAAEPVVADRRRPGARRGHVRGRPELRGGDRSGGGGQALHRDLPQRLPSAGGRSGGGDDGGRRPGVGPGAGGRRSACAPAWCAPARARRSAQVDVDLDLADLAALPAALDGWRSAWVLRQGQAEARPVSLISCSPMHHRSPNIEFATSVVRRLRFCISRVSH